MRPAALFDLDNTLVRGSSLFHFGRTLVREGVLSPRHLAPFVLSEARYARGRGEPAGVADRVATCVLGLVRGRDVADLRALADAWVPQFLSSRGSRVALDAWADLRASGCAVVIATASPQELAEAFAQALGADGSLGTQAEVRNGKFTGLLAAPVAHGPWKAHRVLAWLTERGIDPRTVWGFSDSINDTPLLNAVGIPVAVNADPKLREVARKRGWAEVDEGDSWSAVRHQIVRKRRSLTH